ncbi:MAG TPA: zinc ribbon domain-containing protein [Candidatus Limnocylindria bacterium]|nr:zinc ribbon domain-containing protein [Candidatus Limnocylindria bacterium]
MPIYEYRCTACKEHYEVLVNHTERMLPSCPQCGATGERRLSAFAVGRTHAPASPPGPCGSADCACRRD